MTHDPDLVIGELGLAVLALGLLRHVFLWFVKAPTSPDPWDKETEDAIHEPEAVEVCHRCFDPVAPGLWFCKRCGCSVGPYNNWMPYVIIFSQGEVLRNGVNDKLRPNAFIVVGYLMFSFSMYIIFAPIYWICFFRHLRGEKESVERGEPDQS
jgi:hypothetical protein